MYIEATGEKLPPSYYIDKEELGVLAHSCNLANERLGHRDVPGLSATDPRPRPRINVRIKLKDTDTLS